VTPDEKAQVQSPLVETGASQHPETAGAVTLDAVIFDLDGVVTNTAAVHAAAWKRLFDEYLGERARVAGATGYDPFDLSSDYPVYIDGKRREDGVRSFLTARGIALPEGDRDDPPSPRTIRGLGQLKDAYFLTDLRENGVAVYSSTVSLIKELKRDGVRIGLVSASRNTRAVLEAARLTDLFEVRIDGLVADELALPGKPDPATFVEAANRLDIPRRHAVVVEDALAGVEAGRRGGFGLVVGVDRIGQSIALRDRGADVIVQDLAEITSSDLNSFLQEATSSRRTFRRPST
jgi:beta-phosphoglucomutase family hydrolase